MALFNEVPKIIHVPKLHQNVAPSLNAFPLKFSGATIERIFTFRSKEHSYYPEYGYQTSDPNDQSDWNKLFGLCTGLDAKKESAMWAWRYFNGNLEFTYYCHDSNGIAIYGTKPLLSVGVDTFKESSYTFEFTIHISSFKSQKIVLFIREVDGKTQNYAVSPSIKIPFTKFYRVINAWFGGTSTPSKTIKIY